MRSLLLFVANATASLRLIVQEDSLLRPNGTAIHLTGFNWNTIVHKPLPNDGDTMNAKLPGSNVARILFPWGNFQPYNGTTTTDGTDFCYSNNGNMPDCMTRTPPYFLEACFPCIDDSIAQATSGSSEVWVVLAARGEYIAGQPYNSHGDVDPKGNVFGNPQLAANMYTALAHIATHYKSVDYIAAYEPLSEPRVKTKTQDPTNGVDASVVTAFYAGACKSLQAADPATPCLVGPRPFYNLNTFDSSMLLAGNANVIYSFDYFIPDSYIFGQGHSTKIPTYPGSYACSVLYKGWAPQNCNGTGGQGDVIGFDKAWHRANLAKAAAIKSEHGVPVFVNQVRINSISHINH